jgi:hypothetical protein
LRFVEDLLCKPLVALEYRPTEKFEPGTGDWDPDVERFRPVGDEQVVDRTVQNGLKPRVGF